MPTKPETYGGPMMLATAPPEETNGLTAAKVAEAISSPKLPLRQARALVQNLTRDNCLAPYARNAKGHLLYRADAPVSALIQHRLADLGISDKQRRGMIHLACHTWATLPDSDLPDEFPARSPALWAFVAWLQGVAHDWTFEFWSFSGPTVSPAYPRGRFVANQPEAASLFGLEHRVDELDVVACVSAPLDPIFRHVTRQREKGQ